MVSVRESGRWVFVIGVAALFGRGAVACGGEGVSADDGDGVSAKGGRGGTSGATNGGAAGRAGAGGEGGEGANGGSSGSAGSGGSSGSSGSAGMVVTTCVGGPPLDSIMDGPWIEAGEYHTCFLKRDGSVACWGANDYSPGFIDEDEWTAGAATPPDGTFVRLSASPFSCALDAEGSATCWGQFQTPPAGPLSGIETTFPPWGICGLCTNGSLACSGDVTPPPDGTFVDFTLGMGFGCALSDEGAVTCWGDSDIRSPSARFQRISAGDHHVCGLRVDGSIACWGAGDQEQPTAPPGTFSQVSAGGNQTCALGTDGSVSCWGSVNVLSPPSGTFVQVSTGATHACAVRDDDKVICWGGDGGFQLSPPEDVAVESETFVALSVAGQASVDDEDTDEDFNAWTGGCGLRADDTIGCWGGMAGWEPAGEFVDLDVGYGSACAIDGAGALVCTGVMLGANESLPTGAFTDISVGSFSGCAVRSDGEIVCWNEADYEVPTTPPAGEFVAVSVHDTHVYWPYPEPDAWIEHACALRSDGAAHCFGYGTRPDDRIVDDAFVEIRAGTKDCGRHMDGSVVCWAGATGALESVTGTFAKIGSVNTLLREDGTVFEQERFGAPIETPDEALIDLSSAGDFSCGLTTGGYVRCWGSRVR